MADTDDKLAARDPGDDEDFDDAGPEDDVPMSFWDHVAELRRRLMFIVGGLAVGLVVAWFVHRQLLELLKHPLRSAWQTAGLPGAPELQVLEMQGVLMVDIRVTILGGIFVATPVIFYQVWQFVAPGLYRREKLFVVPFVLGSMTMFAAGAAFAYVYVLPHVITWLLSYNEGSWVNRLLVEHGVRHREVLYQLELANYIKGATRIILAFATVFQLPLLAAVLAKLGVITHKTLLRYWKVAVVIIFVLAGFLTPPEPISQMMMALPMVVLFFVSVGVAYLLNPGEPEIPDAPEIDEPDSAEEAREGGGDGERG
ncbi:MAG: twin-arginine translocase subunit TatC [Myxococcales bacterium FL481]|nr:MAG: twin-arginine translocase subunit TatC [Myxococcales bacterium FL481]